MINCWEVVGCCKSGKKYKWVYGWCYYLEYIVFCDEV